MLSPHDQDRHAQIVAPPLRDPHSP
jgi:hypothetical protein